MLSTSKIEINKKKAPNELKKLKKYEFIPKDILSQETLTKIEVLFFYLVKRYMIGCCCWQTETAIEINSKFYSIPDIDATKYSAPK